jgi:glycosyltransferase involved in cell wall biosynthesis
MRIGFDVTPILAPVTGVAIYASNLLQYLRQIPDVEVVPLTNRPSQGKPRANKTLWMQTLLPWQLLNEHLDTCHFTNYVASLWTPCPSVVTVHDMTLWLYPEYHYRRRLLAMRPLIPLVAHRAQAVIAVSHATKRDMVRILNIPEAKVHVVHSAPAPHFQPLAAGIDRQALRRQLGLPEQYILHVGTIEPRKNLARLVEAFARLRSTGAPQHLLLVGPRGWKAEPVFAMVEQLGMESAVHVMGHVPDAALVAMYNLADVVAIPSLYEGFGLPLVEAMACGAPVVTSGRGALSEIAGEAAEFIDPESVDSLADGLRRVLVDEQRAHELKARGLAQAALYSWQATALATLRVHKACLSEK